MQVGDVISGRYIVIECVVESSVSAVYKCRGPDGVLVAVKLLSLRANNHLRKRFEREMALLEHLKHPAIVDYVDSGMDKQGRLYLVTEWLEGSCLARFRKQKMSFGLVLRFAERIAEALGYVHRNGVIHRDIKPSNILVPDGDVAKAKLIDFGISHWRSRAIGLTVTGTRFGTPPYMSPEQVSGNADIDQRADIFSLGSVLFECITGRRAFPGKTVTAVYTKILYDEPPRTAELVQNVPPSIDQLLSEMMAKDRDKRPCDGYAVADRVRQLRSDLSSWELTGSGRTRRRAVSLTDREQRFVSVILAVAPPSDSSRIREHFDSGSAQVSSWQISEGCESSSSGPTEHVGEHAGSVARDPAVGDPVADGPDNGGDHSQVSRSQLAELGPWPEDDLDGTTTVREPMPLFAHEPEMAAEDNEVSGIVTPILPLGANADQPGAGSLLVGADMAAARSTSEPSLVVSVLDPPGDSTTTGPMSTAAIPPATHIVDVVPSGPPGGAPHGPRNGSPHGKNGEVKQRTLRGVPNQLGRGTGDEEVDAAAAVGLLADGSSGLSARARELSKFSSSSAELTSSSLLGTLEEMKNSLHALGARVSSLRNGAIAAILDNRHGAVLHNARDQAVQAARCALIMQRENPDAVIALATDREIVHLNRVVGEVIDKAVTLLRQAEASNLRAQNGIVVDKVTVSMVATHFEIWKSHGGNLALLGQERMASACSLLGRASPFMSREAELRTLRSTLKDCIDEESVQVCVVTGAAGIGKTRLADEFLSKLYKEENFEFAVWSAQGDTMRSGSPLYLMADMLCRRVGISDRERPDVCWTKLMAFVSQYVGEGDNERICAFLGQLLGLSSPGPEHPQLVMARSAPHLMADQIRRALVDMISAVATSFPLLILIDDLQWVDRASLEVLDRVMHNVDGCPFAVVAFGRPELKNVHPKLWHKHKISEIYLGRLSRRAAKKMVRRALGDERYADCADAIINQADGNPFFLEELIRSVDTGGEELPNSIVAMVQTRLSALEPDARRILRAASIYGARFWRGGVMSLVGQEVVVDDCLMDLVEREMLIAHPLSRLAGETEYEFRNELLRRCAYDMLTEQDRRLGHRLAGSWLESAGESDARFLAHHFERGGAASEALMRYIEAADNALHRGDLDVAIDMAGRGIKCGAQGEELGKLRRIQMENQVWRGHTSAAAKLGIEALQLVPSLSRIWYDIAGEVAIAWGKMAKLDMVQGLTDKLLTADEPTDNAVGRLGAMVKVAQTLFAHGRNVSGERLLAVVEREVKLLREHDLVLRANIHFCRALRADAAGDRVTVLTEVDACSACFEQIGDMRQACLHRANAGYARMELGLFAEAETILRSAVAMAAPLALDMPAHLARQNLALVLAHLGAIDEALDVQQVAGAFFAEQGDRRMAALSCLYRAKILLIARDYRATVDEARTVVDREPEDSPLRAFGLALICQAELQQDQVTGALIHGREAMQLLDKLGHIVNGEMLVRLSYAESLAANDEMSTATAAILTAREQLLMRAAGIQRAAWRTRFLESVPEHGRIMRLAKQWLNS